MMKTCYGCMRPVTYLFQDGRGVCCTRATPEEVQGVAQAPVSKAAEDRSRHDLTWLRVARGIAQVSPDPSTKVGAIVVNLYGVPQGSGYNRFPVAMPQGAEFYADRAYKYKHVKHAEAWALDATSAQETYGATLYTSFPCCEGCMNKAAARGIARVVMPPLPTEGRSEEWVKEWRGYNAAALLVAERYGIAVSIRHV